MKSSTKYIFSISTGRSGPLYLKTIFDHVSGCRAFHESPPVGNNEIMQLCSVGRTGSMRRVAQDKAKAIRQIMRNCDVYVETNHCFIKGFGWYIAGHLPEEKMGVIILKRNRERIVSSLQRIGCTPLSKYGRDWILTPDTKQPRIPPPAVLSCPRATYHIARLLKFASRCVRFVARKAFRKKLPAMQWVTDYETACLNWYVEETAARAEDFKKRFPRIKYYEVDIDDLNSLEDIHKMLACFGLTESRSLDDIIGKPVNLR